MGGSGGTDRRSGLQFSQLGGADGQKWLDVARGKVACEAGFALDDNGNPLNRDWKEGGGKICLAAFALH